MSESLKTVESPNFDNLDNEQRKFSLTNLFVRNTSVEEALRRDSKILINGGSLLLYFSNFYKSFISLFFILK